MFLFSGGCPSAYIKQSLFIHSTSGNGGKPVKKIPASATVLPTMKVEVQSPYNRISISHNRKGHKAFAVFLLSFLVGKCRRTIIGVKCRSPPFNLDFYVFKDSDWLEEKRMAYNNGREDRKWRIWKEAEEKVLCVSLNRQRSARKSAARNIQWPHISERTGGTCLGFSAGYSCGTQQITVLIPRVMMRIKKYRKDYRFKALKFDRRRGILYLHFILSCLLSERRKHCKDSRKKSPPCTVVWVRTMDVKARATVS